jgi:hypothetical protein
MAVGPSDGVHEFLMASFNEGIEADCQLAIMEALGHHLRRCEGVIGREYFRSADGHWVEHVVWASQADLEAAAGLEADAEVARLFECFDTRTVAYACCERVEDDRIDAGAGAGVL